MCPTGASAPAPWQQAWPPVQPASTAVSVARAATDRTFPSSASAFNSASAVRASPPSQAKVFRISSIAVVRLGNGHWGR